MYYIGSETSKIYEILYKLNGKFKIEFRSKMFHFFWAIEVSVSTFIIIFIFHLHVNFPPDQCVKLIIQTKLRQKRERKTKCACIDVRNHEHVDVVCVCVFASYFSSKIKWHVLYLFFLVRCYFLFRCRAGSKINPPYNLLIL